LIFGLKRKKLGSNKSLEVTADPRHVFCAACQKPRRGPLNLTATFACNFRMTQDGGERAAETAQTKFVAA
jgi:hypothetical protein